MAVASGPAGQVLAGPVFSVIFETAHAQIMNNVWGRSYWYSYLATTTATTDSTAQDKNAHQQSEAKASQAHIWGKKSCVPG